jgi:hypothetical protein
MSRITRSILSFLLCATGAVLFAQQPAPTPPAKPAAKPAAAPAPVKPSSVAPMPVTVTYKLSPADLAALTDLNDRLKLDNLSYQTEQDQAAQTDPVIRQAQQLIAKRLASLPDVQATKQQADQDFAAMQAKMAALRASLKLGPDWQVDLNTGEWIEPQSGANAAPMPTPPAPAVPPVKK